MKAYKISEYAKLTGKSVVTIYKSLRYKPFITVIKGEKCIAIPDDIDPMTLEPREDGVNRVINSLKPEGMAAEAPQRPSDGGADDDRANTHPKAAPGSTDAQQALKEELERVTRERDELRRQAVSREQLIAAKEETLRILTEQLAQLREASDRERAAHEVAMEQLRTDLAREQAAHAEDRARDKDSMDKALERQHELSVLLLQEQNRHKPLRLLLAEKAESIFHKKTKKEDTDL